MSVHHVDEAALWDALEGDPTAEVQEHLDACPECRAEVEEARDALGWARDASVPEPSPLFWEGFRRNVRRRIAQRERWVHAVGWASVSTLAASLLLALRLGTLTPATISEPRLPAWTALPAIEDDAGLAVLRAMQPAEADVPIAGGDLAARVIELDDERGALLAEAAQREFATTGEEDL